MLLLVIELFFFCLQVLKVPGGGVAKVVKILLQVLTSSPQSSQKERKSLVLKQVEINHQERNRIITFLNSHNLWCCSVLNIVCIFLPTVMLLQLT